MTQWNNPKTTPPPHDRAILAVFSPPTPEVVMAVWSESDTSWSIGILESNTCVGKQERFYISARDDEANMVAWQEMPEFTMEDMTEVWGTLSLNAFKSLDKFECLQLEPTTMQRARAHLPRIDKLLNSPSVPENYKRKLRGVKYFLENPESTDASGCSRLNQQLSELEDRVLKANAPEEDK